VATIPLTFFYSVVAQSSTNTWISFLVDVLRSEARTPQLESHCPLSIKANWSHFQVHDKVMNLTLGRFLLTDTSALRPLASQMILGPLCPV